MGSGVRYTEEFRAQVVRMVIESSRPVVDVALEVNVRPDTVRTWVNRAKHLDKEQDKGLADQTSVDVKKLQRRVRELEQENSFLKKAAAFFAADQHPNSGSR